MHEIKVTLCIVYICQVLENFIPPLLDAVLLDYQKTNVHCAREPEVLSAMATIVNKLEGHITSEVPKIFDAVFECTLEMINKDFEEFPEHRTNFFLLLQVIIATTIMITTCTSQCLKFVSILGSEYLLFPRVPFNPASTI